ncbi:glutathione S-transferase family protein [Sphingomonas sp. RHCKR7]|uniref:glutathione S-transferase family protein n=1 Tax=Sphingomonas folli TaxID=2862497 RepID=UPI001C66CC97|nr:glutathione S-transferase family protein [Sphingomonas folli]MBW6527027.1 glutathione S-transferase family protein [Sphingomonas folli]
MLTLFHAPRSRSTRIIWLLEELGVPYQLRYVTIRYRDGSGDGPDAANPHPDKKVPALLDDAILVTESAAVATYLADQADGAGLAPWIGDRDRGPYLTWLSWIEGEFGPAIGARLGAPEADPEPAFTAAVARIERALAEGPWLLGERFSAADVMLGATLAWAQHLMPRDGAIPAYLARLSQRPAFQRAMTRDAVPAA